MERKNIRRGLLAAGAVGLLALGVYIGDHVASQRDSDQRYRVRYTQPSDHYGIQPRSNISTVDAEGLESILSNRYLTNVKVTPIRD